MEKLKDPRKEKFCQLIANEDLDPAEAAFQAGYGCNSPDHCKKRDGYHSMAAGRLMAREDVTMRIHTLRQLNAYNDQDFANNIIKTLKDVVAFDQTKYLQSSECELPNGRTVTDVYLKKQIQYWDRQDALMVNGFDGRGMPKFLDKAWALDKLIRIYGLEEKSGVDVEDMLTLFAGAGLAIGKPEQTESKESLEKSVDDDIDSFIEEG